MKKIGLFLVLALCIGCVTVKIPKYLQDEFPYQKVFHANFDDTLAATTQALNDLHWKIANTSHPSVFEQEAISDDTGRQILLFTEVRQTPFFLSSKYMSLNVYVREIGEGADVEIRYLAITPVLFKDTKSYRNDAVVNKVFNRIDSLLAQ